MRRRLRRILRRAVAVLALVLIIIVIGIAASWHCQLQSELPAPALEPQERKAATAGITTGIKDYARPEDDTYLSYPEWYIVWSYQEKADFQQAHLPSGFPYFGAVQQYWGSYCCISRLTEGKRPFNAGEHIMLVVIGTSFSAEYILKGTYEKTIGRVSEWTSGNQPVEEDRYAYKVAREYANFVHIRPFYEFHFAHHVNGLWTETHFWGAHWLRKCERKVFLSVDYALEALYCWLIEKTTHASYGYEPADTYAWIDNANLGVFQQSRLKQVKQVGSKAFIVDIPRYQEFTAIASELAQRGVRFVDIAGNSRIIVSVIAPQSWRYERSNARQLFSSVILTRPETKRVVIGCDVGSLTDVLKTLGLEGVEVEHIYDY